jgi:hypothetical protein
LIKVELRKSRRRERVPNFIKSKADGAGGGVMVTKCLNDLFKVRKIVNRNIIDVENVGKAKAGSPSTDVYQKDRPGDEGDHKENQIEGVDQQFHEFQ